MSFFRRSRIISSYSLIGSRLEFVNSFVDLGILIDPKLNIINHINATTSKARSSFFKKLARTPEIGQGLGRILSCGARKQEQT